MNKIYIGIDNGITGSIGIITPDQTSFLPVPSRSMQDYTKKKQNISRLDRDAFRKIITTSNPDGLSVFVLFEHPFWNPILSLKSSKSGVMCLEAEVGIIEDLLIPHESIPSSTWQKELLPVGCKGKAELKKASQDIGIRLYPALEDEIRKQKDADGLLIAEYARRKGL